jgi:hypothetical protein
MKDLNLGRAKASELKFGRAKASELKFGRAKASDRGSCRGHQNFVTLLFNFLYFKKQKIFFHKI